MTDTSADRVSLNCGDPNINATGTREVIDTHIVIYSHNVTGTPVEVVSFSNAEKRVKKS